MSINNSSTKKTNEETLEEQFVECVCKAQDEGVWSRKGNATVIPNMAKWIFTENKKDMVDDILKAIQKKVIACGGKIGYPGYLEYTYYLESPRPYPYTDETLNSLHHFIYDGLTEKLDSMIGSDSYILILKHESRYRGGPTWFNYRFYPN